jgi:hypothetical protein
MQKVEFTDQLILTLKGAPLSCLMLLALARQPVSAQYLERHSGYSDKPVNEALLLLQDYGLVTRNDRYAWRIAINVTQLPLMILPDENEPDIVQDSMDSDQQQPNSEITDTTRNNSESEKIRVLSSSRSIDLTSKELIDLPLLDLEDPEKFRVAENLEACDRFGIKEPKRSVISKLKHVTSRLICFHCCEAPNIGFAIYRIQKDWRVRDDWIDPKDRGDRIPGQWGFEPVDVCAQTLSTDDLELWQATLESVRAEFSKVDFETWLKSAKLYSVDGDGWTIRTGNSYAADWIKEHALAALQSVAGVSIKVEW